MPAGINWARVDQISSPSPPTAPGAGAVAALCSLVFSPLAIGADAPKKQNGTVAPGGSEGGFAGSWDL